MEQNVAVETVSDINGVDVCQLQESIRALRANPSLGEASFRATNQWRGGALNETRIDDFYCMGQERRHKHTFVFQNDEAPELLGRDDGANPVEFVLHALAGCITTTTVYHAAARGIRISSVRTTLEGKLDLQGLMQTNPTVPSGYQNIRVTMKIESDASGDKLAELKKLFAFSPVFDTLTRAIPVQVSVEM